MAAQGIQGGGLTHGHGHEHFPNKVRDRAVKEQLTVDRRGLLISVHQVGHRAMGQADTRREMEAGAHEASREAPRPRVDARGDDPHSLHDTRRFSNCVRQVEAGLPQVIPRKRELELDERKCCISCIFIQVCTLIGMWLIPLALSIKNYWWRFIVIWLMISTISGVISKKALEKPIRGSTPRYGVGAW